MYLENKGTALKSTSNKSEETLESVHKRVSESNEHLQNLLTRLRSNVTRVHGHLYGPQPADENKTGIEQIPGIIGDLDNQRLLLGEMDRQLIELESLL